MIFPFPPHSTYLFFSSACQFVPSTDPIRSLCKVFVPCLRCLLQWLSGNLSDFKRRREVELKHGRVAMFLGRELFAKDAATMFKALSQFSSLGILIRTCLLSLVRFATIGYILPEYWRFPGYLSKFLETKFCKISSQCIFWLHWPVLGICALLRLCETSIYDHTIHIYPRFKLVMAHLDALHGSSWRT